MTVRHLVPNDVEPDMSAWFRAPANSAWRAATERRLSDALSSAVLIVSAELLEWRDAPAWSAWRRAAMSSRGVTPCARLECPDAAVSRCGRIVTLDTGDRMILPVPMCEACAADPLTQDIW